MFFLSKISSGVRRTGQGRKEREREMCSSGNIFRTLKLKFFKNKIWLVASELQRPNISVEDFAFSPGWGEEASKF